jgi:hypothetical protein
VKCDCGAVFPGLGCGGGNVDAGERNIRIAEEASVASAHMQDAADVKCTQI